MVKKVPPTRFHRLCPQHIETLRVLGAWWRDNEYGPSLVELGQKLGVTGPTVQQRLEKLEAAKLVTRTPGAARSWRPTGRKP